LLASVTKKKVRDLFDAIETRRLDDVRRMLERDPALLEARGAGRAIVDDKTPLMFALQCGHSEIAGLLLDHGADVRATMTESWQWPTLHFAARMAATAIGTLEHVAILERLLALGADPNATDRSGNTALDRALLDYDAESDHARVIEILVASGADPEHRGPSGSTTRKLVAHDAHLYSAAVRKAVGAP
jgi:ankyrin repeat protein